MKIQSGSDENQNNFRKPKGSRAITVSTSASPMVRALLTTDGSFTLLLEAFTGELVVAQPIESRQIDARSSDRRVSKLEASAKEKLLYRTALLKTESGKIAAYVESITVMGRMSKEIQRELASDSQTPIGKMLREERLETFREIIETKSISNPKTLKYLGKGEKPMRTYIIFARQLPIMAVTEYINFR